MSTFKSSLAVVMGGLAISSAVFAFESTQTLSPTIVLHEMHHRHKHAATTHTLKGRYATHIRHWFSCINSGCVAATPKPNHSITVYGGGGCAPGISAVAATRYGDDRDYECYIFGE
jgi:hypothetical protein